MKVVLAPGAFDSIPEDEQEDLFKELQEKVDDGSLFENSEEVDMEALEKEDPELYKLLIAGVPKLQ